MVSIALDVAYGRERSPATSDPSKNMFRMNTSGRTLVAAAALLGGMTLGVGQAMAISPTISCDNAGIGSVTLMSDDQLPAQATTLSATPAMTPASVPFCLVKVLVPQAINIWVGLPDNWNGRWQSLGGSGPYFGSVSAPILAVNDGYAGAASDAGHTRPDGSFACVNNCVGNSASNPGQPNVPLQIDFAYRSEHLMAVIGKQLVQAYYGQPPVYSYWNGCAGGGRQGLRMAQDYPNDYDGILAGAPAIPGGRLVAGLIWPQVVQYQDNGGLIGGGVAATLLAKENLATSRAVAACDALDGVIDGVLTDPRMCTYSAAEDPAMTRATCTAGDPSCLTPTEASAIDKMWQGPASCGAGIRGAACRVPYFANQRLWYPPTRGTALEELAGVTPIANAVNQPRYWVYFDPTWDWRVLDYFNYVRYIKDTVNRVGPLMASDNPNLVPFRDHGGKLVMWHGFADQRVAPGWSIDYYDAVTQAMGGGYERTQQFARLFMAPGVAHCGGGTGPQPQRLFDAVVDWVEHGQAPDKILASKAIAGGMQTRPLCPYPELAVYGGIGSTDDAANFSCARLDGGHD